MDNNPFYTEKIYQSFISIGYEKKNISPMCGAIDNFINKLDLNFLNDSKKSNDREGGRPFFDRKSLLKLILLSIYKRVSIVNIDQQFGVESEFNYLLEPNTIKPKRQTFFNFLKELDGHIVAIFHQFIKLIEVEYKLDLNQLYCDGTVFDAHNDRHKIITDINVKRSINKLSKDLNNENICDTELEVLRKKMIVNDERLEKMKLFGRKSYGRTDEDCVILKDKNGAYIAGYNAQLVEENNNGLIIYVHISNKNPDCEVFEEMFESLFAVFPFISMTFDAGYGTINILQKFKDLGVKAITKSRKDKEDENVFFISDLVFNEDFSIAICPHKNVFTLVNSRSKDEFKRKYLCPDCTNCTTDLKCKLRGKDGFLFVNIKDYELVSDAKKTIKTQYGKEQYRLRGNKCESPNGYIKGFLHAKKLTMNGLSRARVMVYLYSFLYNFQRLINLKIKQNEKS